MATERVQVSDLNEASIKPAASPVSTYYRPAEDTVAKPGVQAKWAKDLAEGLEIIKPSADRFGEAYHKKYTEEEIRKGAEARLRNQKDFKSAVAAGDIPEAANPWFIKGYMQQTGRLDGMEYDNALRLAWADHPVKNSDDPKAFDKFMGEFRQEFMKTKQGGESNPDWLEGFAPQMNRAENNLSAQHVSYRQHEISDRVRENAAKETMGLITSWQDFSRGVVWTADEKNASISSLADNITAMGRDMVAKGMSGSDMNKIMADAIIVKAKDTRDGDVLKLLDLVQTGSGRLGGIADIKARRVETEMWLRDYEWSERQRNIAIEDRPYHLAMQQAALENIDYTKKQRERAEKEYDRVEQVRMSEAEYNSEIALNPAKPLDPDRLAKLARIDPHLPNRIVAWREHMLSAQDRIITDDGHVMKMMSDMAADPTGFDLNRIWSGPLPENRKFDTNTAFTLFNQWKSIKDTHEKDPIFQDPIFKIYMDRIGRGIAGNEAQTNAGKQIDAANGQRMFYEAIKNYRSQKPGAADSDIFVFMKKRSLEITAALAEESITTSKTLAAEEKSASDVNPPKAGAEFTPSPAQQAQIDMWTKRQQEAIQALQNPSVAEIPAAGVMWTRALEKANAQLSKLRPAGEKLQVAPRDLRAFERAYEANDQEAIREFYARYPFLNTERK